ncbi:KUP/HAK/KT family potassium transporter [Spirosoma fluminis]
MGIVFGDMGTSPLYTYRAVIEDHVVDETLAPGGSSVIFWMIQGSIGLSGCDCAA